MKKENVVNWLNFLLKLATEEWDKKNYHNADKLKSEAFGTIQTLDIIFPEYENEITAFWDAWEAKYYGFD